MADYKYPFVLKVRVNGSHMTPMGWTTRARGAGRNRIPAHGPATEAGLAAWIRGFEESCLSGWNKHLGPMKIAGAALFRPNDPKPVATYGNW